MITPPPKTAYVETYEVVWRPHRDAPSLVSDGISGSTLTNLTRETIEQIRNRAAWVRRRHSYRRRANGNWL